MKYIAIIMVFVLVAAIGGAGYIYMTANLTFEAIAMQAFDAIDQQATFQSLKSQLANDLVLGTVFQKSDLASTKDYAFYTYTVRLKNDSYLTADMVEIQVVPVSGDILQIGDRTPRALAPRSTGDISATILTTQGTSAIREIVITYYIWGQPFTLRETYRG